MLRTVNRAMCFATLALVSAAGACSAFQSADGAGGPTDDAGAPDATSVAPADAGPAGSDASATTDGGYLVDEGFEDGCVGWSSLRATLTPVTTAAHSGAKSCRVCPNGGVDVSTIVSAFIPIATGGVTTRYQLDFYALAEASTTGGGGVQPYAPDGSVVSGTFPALVEIGTKNWTHIQVAADVPAESTSAKVQGVFTITDGGPCVLVDDLTFGLQR